MGNKRLLADLLWVITLLESDESHYKQKGLNSWMFLRFNTITSLDNKFLEAYQFGGQYLSIVKDDLYGAEVIFDRGLQYYPKDYDLNLNSGFLQAFELQNYKKAISNYTNILDLPKAPKFIISIINKLKYSTTGDLQITYQLVEESYKNTKDEILKAKLVNDLYALRAMIDLECLNTKKTNTCRNKDLNGNYYRKRGNKYIAPVEFEPYKIFKR